MSDPSAAAPPLDTLALASLSDAGRVRPENQDAAAVMQNTSGERLLIVADGMGGHLGGETAARLCLQHVERCFRDPHGTPEERLRHGLELANEEIYSFALANPELRGMGTTAVVLLFHPSGTGWVAWVGDSRAYRLRAGTLEALTRDHSLMAEWISLGVLSAESAQTHPRRHELTRALGQSPDVTVDVVPVDVRAGDRFLLCSDGLHGYVPERALRLVLGEGAPEECARTLVERANANGGSDNVSVVIGAFAAATAPAATAAAASVAAPPVAAATVAPVSEPAPIPEPSPEPPRPQPLEPAPVQPPALELADPGTSFSAELAFATDPLAELAPEPAPTAAPAQAAAPALDFGEISFDDLLAPDSAAAAELAPPAPATAPPPAPDVAPGPATFVPLLDPPVSAREIRIPLMMPVRRRRGLDARSALAGVAATLAAGGLAFWLWGNTGLRREIPPQPPAQPRDLRALPPRPALPERAPKAQEPVARAELPPAPPVPAPAQPPAPQPVAPALPAAPVEPALVPVPLPTPQVAIARPPVAPPPAAPASAEPAPLATSAGFELPAPVERFVDDWLRAQTMRDAKLLAALGLAGAPDELAGNFGTRDAFKLVAAAIDEERSQGDRYYVRLVVSYAFRDATGRFRTQDEHCWILRESGGRLRYEGRWRQ